MTYGIEKAPRVQAVILPEDDAAHELEGLVVELRATFGRAPLVVRRDDVRGRRGPMDAAVVTADTGPLARALIAAHHCRTMRPAPLLLFLALQGRTAIGGPAAWQSIARAGYGTRKLVLGVERVGWATRGRVFVPGGRFSSCGTRALAASDWIDDATDLDRHLEIGASVAPKSMAAISTLQLLEHAARSERPLMRACGMAYASATWRSRNVAVEDAPVDERGLPCLVDVVGGAATGLLPTSAATPDRASERAPAIQFDAPVRSPSVRPSPDRPAPTWPRQSLGMLWRLPSGTPGEAACGARSRSARQ